MLTVEEVERIAKLGRLNLTDDEKARYARQLSNILDYANQLAEIDVDSIPPTATVLSVRSVVRDGDAVSGQIDRADALMNAPATDGKSFVVQATLDHEEA